MLVHYNPVNLIQTSCKKLVDIPTTYSNFSENKIYATDATAIGVLDGIYTGLTLGGSLCSREYKYRSIN
jgi:hypothetical protein